MDRAQLDAAYNNSAAVPTVDAMRADWDARSTSLRQSRRGRLDLKYGVGRASVSTCSSPTARTHRR
jgi:hypothetical protein